MTLSKGTDRGVSHINTVVSSFFLSSLRQSEKQVQEEGTERGNEQLFEQTIWFNVLRSGE